MTVDSDIEDEAAALAATSVIAAITTVIHAVIDDESPAKSREKRKKTRRSRPNRPPIPYQLFMFSLDSLADEVIYGKLRFTRVEIETILPFLWLDSIKYRNRYNPPPEKALYIVLARLAWPHRLIDLTDIFGCSAQQLSMIFNDVTTHLAKTFQHKLFWESRYLSLTKILAFGQAIKEHGGGDKVWGWVDGTIVEIARLEKNQEVCYTGYKKRHGLKF